VIVRANYSHAGIYTCRASNRVNTIDSNMTVLVSGKLVLHNGTLSNVLFLTFANISAVP